MVLTVLRAGACLHFLVLALDTDIGLQTTGALQKG
jgi:hypothetical protein